MTLDKPRGSVADDLDSVQNPRSFGVPMKITGLEVGDSWQDGNGGRYRSRTCGLFRVKANQLVFQIARCCNGFPVYLHDSDRFGRSFGSTDSGPFPWFQMFSGTKMTTAKLRRLGGAYANLVDLKHYVAKRPGLNPCLDLTATSPFILERFDDLLQGGNGCN
jgi:hypothetical protein